MHVENAAGDTLLRLSDIGGLAIGYTAEVSGNAAVAIGNGAEATNQTATAIGDQALASGSRATALGFQTTASGDYASAMGWATTASGAYSFAVGVGTTASGHGSVATGNGVIAATENSLSIGGWNSANSTADNTAFVVGNGTNPATGGSRSDALMLDVDGNLTIAGSLTQSSDRRLKEDIAPLGSVLSRLEGIAPVTYRFKEGVHRSTDSQIGLIAQDVQEAFPKLVGEGSNGYLTVSYTNFTAVLLKAVQELEAENDALQAEVEALRGGPVSAPLAGMLPVAGLLLGVLCVGGVVAWRRRGPLG